MAPAAFQFVKGGVEFSPLTTRKKTPFEGILKPVVVLAAFTPSEFCSCSLDIGPVQNGVLPTAVICSLPNHRVQFAPVAGRERFAPIIEIGENKAYSPE